MPSGYYAYFIVVREERVLLKVGQLVIGIHGMLPRYGMQYAVERDITTA